MSFRCRSSRIALVVLTDHIRQHLVRNICVRTGQISGIYKFFVHTGNIYIYICKPLTPKPQTTPYTPFRRVLWSALRAKSIFKNVSNEKSVVSWMIFVIVEKYMC